MVSDSRDDNRGTVGGDATWGMSRRQFLRLASVGTLAVGGAGLLVACGGESRNGGTSGAGRQGTASGDSGIDAITLDQPLEISFWHIQATLYGEAIKEIVTKFNQENQYKITVKEIFQGDYGALNQKLRASLQGGGLPEVSMAYESDTLEYMRTRVVLPLDDYLASKKYGLTAEQIKDVSPGVLERQRIAAYEGKTMSWIHGNSSQGMYYNKAVLKQAGIETPAKSWDEFVGQARKIKESARLPALPVGTGPGGLLTNIIRSNGVAPLADDGKSSNFDKPEVVAGLELLKRLFDDGLAYTAENTEQEFTNGRAAFEIGTTARTSSKIDLIKDKFPWGITLTPQGKAAQPITTLFGGNQVLFDKKDAKRNLAGWLFMRYFGGAEAQAIYAARTGYFPGTLSSKSTDLLKQNYQQFPQKQQAFDEVFPAARIFLPSAAGNSIDKMVSDKTTEVILGKTTPADAAVAMKREADRMLKDLAS